jgi:hypothetical protein
LQTAHEKLARFISKNKRFIATEQSSFLGTATVFDSIDSKEGYLATVFRFFSVTVTSIKSEQHFE